MTKQEMLVLPTVETCVLAAGGRGTSTELAMGQLGTSVAYPSIIQATGIWHLHRGYTSRSSVTA